MAWTWSARDRGTVAIWALMGTSQKNLANHLNFLGKGDQARGLCIAFAAFLTVAGATAPTVAPETLTSFLFLCAAALALLVMASFRENGNRASTDVKRPEWQPQPHQTVLLDLLVASHSNSTLDTETAIDRATPDRATNVDKAAWARLTAHMSHELRTPLNAVLGFSELMTNEVFGPLGASCYADYARDIHASGRQLLKSAEDALAITALLTAPDRNGQPPATLMSTALAGALQFCEFEFACRNIAISIEDNLDGAILAEAQTLRQMLVNMLLDVAGRASPGSTISITSRQSSGQVEITLTLIGDPLLKPACADNFALLLARTLSELLGARLSSGTCANENGGVWRTIASFTAVSQRDFFTSP